MRHLTFINIIINLQLGSILLPDPSKAPVESDGFNQLAKFHPSSLTTDFNDVKT